MSLDTKFELIDSESGLLALEPDWRNLFEATGRPSSFLDFDWVLMCWRRMTMDGPHRPFIATVREAGRLVLAIPVQRQRYHFVFSRYYGLETAFPQYNDGLVASGNSSEAWVAVLRRGLGNTSLATTLVLNRIPTGSRLLEALRPVAKSSIMTSVAAVELVAGYDAYFSAFAGPTRNQIGRMERRLAQTGPVVMRNSLPESFEDDLDWILEHKRVWTPPGGRKLRDWVVLPGYERDVKELGRKWIKTGQMTIGIIEAGGHRVAGGMVLASGRRATFYLTTYDPEYAKVSPGRMLALWRLEHAARAGSTFFDFMAGRFEWKERLSTTDFDVLRLKLPLR